MSGVETYFTETVWPWWRAVKFHEGKPGPRATAIKSFLKRASTIEEAQKIFAALQAQVRYYAEQERAYKKVDRMPFLATWLNQRRDEDEIGSHSELKEQAAKQEKKCTCGVVTNVFFFRDSYTCERCYLKTVDLDPLREAFVKHGLKRKPDESADDWRKRLLRTTKESVQKMIVRREKYTPRELPQQKPCVLCNGERRYREEDSRDSPWLPCPVCVKNIATALDSIVVR